MRREGLDIAEFGIYSGRDGLFIDLPSSLCLYYGRRAVKMPWYCRVLGMTTVVCVLVAGFLWLLKLRGCCHLPY